jgi:hypothetical protein
MGAWGVKLYQSDTASDIKDEYTDQLRKGKGNEEIVNDMIAENEDILSDEEEAAEFWFALADTQWRYGRLLPYVKEKALEYLDRTEHLDVWEEAGEKDYKARVNVLEELKQQLLSPMPQEKKVSQYRIYKCEWKIGDIFAYKFTSEYSEEKDFYGKYIIFRKVSEGIWYPGHVVPIIHVYKMLYRGVPDIKDINILSYLPLSGFPEYVDIKNEKIKYRVELLNTSKRVIPYNNLIYLGNANGVELPNNEVISANPYALSWKRFENDIIKYYEAWKDIDV